MVLFVVCFQVCTPPLSLFFFFNDTATTEIYTLSLHDALPISPAAEQAREVRERGDADGLRAAAGPDEDRADRDRKSTRLNSSHSQISYAVFCLKKKKKKKKLTNVDKMCKACRTTNTLET